MQLYDDKSEWYDLLDPLEDHEQEVDEYSRALTRALEGSGPSTGALPRLLELGSGGGHNAHYFKERFDCVLVDASEGMLRRSATLNPECRKR